MSSLLLVALLSVANSVAALTQPTVTVLNGTLRGSKCPSSNVNSFLSIPYAKPPIADLRFAPPQPFDQKFNGTLDATIAAPACIQFNTGFNESTPESENCLFIDVWAPANATANSKLPVRVWLFGGVNEAGGISDGLYDGCFASTNTIQVSINYRVGPLGFLVSQSLGLTGNYGIQDQLLGLEWVRDNIAAFGGDPSRVMLFGQSAGGGDTRIVSGLERAKPLIHAAIMESGNYIPLPNLTVASQENQRYVDALNCSAGNLTCVRSTSVAALVTTFIKADYSTLFSFVVVDGTTVPTAPTTPLVPSIIGTTGNEGSLFILSDFGSRFLSLNETSYETWLSENFAPAAAQAIAQKYPLSQFSSAANPAFAALSLVSTYAYFRCPARQLASNAAAAGVPVWTYSFDHTPSCAWYAGIPQVPALLAALGAAHTAELPFVFGQMTDLPRPDGTCNMTAAEVALSAAVRGTWDAMAADASPGAGWPLYAANASLGANVINGTNSSSSSWEFGVVDYSMCDFWDPIIGNINGGAISSSRSNGTSNSTGNSTGTAHSGGVMSTAPHWWANMVAVSCMLLVLLFTI